MKKLLLLISCLVLTLAGCADDKPIILQKQTDNGPKIVLDVLSVIVLDKTDVSLASSPYATNNFQPTIANAIRQWATDKIVAAGSTGEAIIVIRDASLKSEAIPHPDSTFTREQTSKYMARAEVEINVARRNDKGEVIANASQFVTLPSEPTSVERDNAYTKLLNALMQDLNGSLRTGIQQHLASFTLQQPSQPPMPGQ